MINIRRVLIALLIALLIAGALYGIAVGAGVALYASDTIATGATHNDCDGFRGDLADEQGIDERDVEQRDIKQRAATCLATHELTEREAFRSEYLFWGAWPAAICAVIFLLWPAWSRILHNQEQSDEEAGDDPPARSHEANTMQ